MNEDTTMNRKKPKFLTQNESQRLALYNVYVATCEAANVIVSATIKDDQVRFNAYEGDVTDWSQVDVNGLEAPFLWGTIHPLGHSIWELSSYYYAGSKKDLTLLSDIMVFCHDWAFELCPDWPAPDGVGEPDGLVFDVQGLE